MWTRRWGRVVDFVALHRYGGYVVASWCSRARIRSCWWSRRRWSFNVGIDGVVVVPRGRHCRRRWLRCRSRGGAVTSDCRAVVESLWFSEHKSADARPHLFIARTFYFICHMCYAVNNRVDYWMVNSAAAQARRYVQQQGGDSGFRVWNVDLEVCRSEQYSAIGLCRCWLRRTRLLMHYYTLKTGCLLMNVLVCWTVQNCPSIAAERAKSG